jgi:hypothetical protein
MRGFKALAADNPAPCHSVGFVRKANRHFHSTAAPVAKNQLTIASVTNGAASASQTQVSSVVLTVGLRTGAASRRWAPGRNSMSLSLRFPLGARLDT